MFITFLLGLHLLVSDQEKKKVIKSYFNTGQDDSVGRLVSLPVKEKKKLIVLEHIMQCFDSIKQYTETEINHILEPIYDDIFLVRRTLVDYGFMNRTRDGSSYWVNNRDNPNTN